MRTKKYWFLGGIVLTCLCVAIVLAENQPYNSTSWEYARYSVVMTSTNPAVSIYSWGTPTQRFGIVGKSSASNLWREAGFDSGNKDVLIEDWFNFLGKQGWELVCIEANKGALEDTTYWFKRHK